MRIGDRVIVDGYPATIVGLLAEKLFADGYPSDDWAYLRTGILVEDDAAGLIHYPNLAELHIQPLSD